MTPEQLSEPSGSEYQSEFLQKNSTVAGPVRNLLDLQSQYFALNQQFQNEMWRLEQQHYACCQSLFQDRQAIINGKKKNTALYSAVAAQRHGHGSSSSPVPASGIPFFWLRAMKNNQTIAEWIHDRDEPALSYLCDVRVEFVDGEDVTGFRIVFEFDRNPFFSNAMLTKEFIYERGTPQDDIYGELLYIKATGCVISWHPGQNLTDMTMTAPGQIEYQSFFDFFESTSYEDDESSDSEGGDDGESDGSDAVTSGEENLPRRRGRTRPRDYGDYDNEEERSDDDSVEEINRDSNDGSENGTSENDDWNDEEEHSDLDCHFELGEEFKDRLIPYAIHWYTGEALNFEDDDDEDEDEDDDEDDDDDDDNEDNEE